MQNIIKQDRDWEYLISTAWFQSKDWFIYETRIFNSLLNDEDIYCKNYTTLEDSLSWHQDIVNNLESILDLI